MATAVVVPDASVILKWVLPPADEADVDRALALRDAIVRPWCQSFGCTKSATQWRGGFQAKPSDYRRVSCAATCPRPHRQAAG